MRGNAKKKVKKHKNSSGERENTNGGKIEFPLRQTLGELARHTKVYPELKSEKLAYVKEMLIELQKLSSTFDEPMIDYLIEMAILETQTAMSVIEFDQEN